MTDSLRRFSYLQSKRSVVTNAEIVRRETLELVREIDKVLREMDSVQEFDEGLFGMLVERVRVMNIVQVEFVLRAGVGVVEVIWYTTISIVLSHDPGAMAANGTFLCGDD